MTILVTGATGNLGRLIIAGLLERGADPQSIVAGARNTEKAADLGVRVVHLDYSDPASVATAVEGIDTVVLVSGSEVGQRVAQHRAVIDAAKAAGVSKLVYTSVPKATTSDLVLAPEHKATEELIAAAGVPAVILRNNWYTENYIADLTRSAETGVLAAGAGDGRVASASRRDFADAAAAVALEDGHIGKVYELAGDVAWTYSDLAATFSELTGREVSYVRLGFDDQVAALREAGFDEGTAGFVAALDAGIKDGALADTDGTLSRLIGRPTTPLIEGLRAASA
ncbi:SDR family oxidoreductase [Microbacterium maritypicum]|uniref:SDR family oxidoreductase n=1 Tax=Microbacterium maritypicum TaxID=33918 RepID=A0AAJ6AQD6_MICMQ|nr:SDR family oxidoreductase [Microbacterium liquefaciens]MBP5800469.1 SDR family oxidoreductase [Microbacterium liquefaciens]WEF21879.1 SDR family oxidoreductase [Microbacterium liquefaciens]